MNWKEPVSAALGRVEGTGRFATQGDCQLPDPGLVVDGVGPIALPLRASQVRLSRLPDLPPPHQQRAGPS